MTPRSPFPTAAALAATAFLASCGGGADSASSSVPSVRTSISLAQTGTALAAHASPPLSDAMGGRIPQAAVDSLIVTVTQVDVLPDSLLASCRPPVGDSTRGFRPGAMGGGFGMSGPNVPASCQAWRNGGRTMGPGSGRMGGGMPDSVVPFPRPDNPRTRDDSLLPPGIGWGSHLDQWYSLGVVGSGRIDLFHLPTDSATGLTLAADSVPAGDYGAARLVVSDATIWLNTAVTTEDGVTLQPDTGYAVKLPARAGEAMGIMTSAGFTVPSGGGNVVLMFDVGQLLAVPIVTDSGKVVLGPMLRPRRM